MRSFLGIFVAILVAFIAQKWLREGDLNAALFMFLVAGGIFARYAAGPLPWPTLPPRRLWPKAGWRLAIIGSLLVLLATLTGFLREHYGGWAFWLWVAGMWLFFVGVWLDDVSPAPDSERLACQPRYTSVLSRRTLGIALLLILLVAVFARFYALSSYPHGLQSDEANNGLDALKWLAGAPYTPYAETNEGQATLFTYMIALFIQLFGQSVTTMRMVSATVGVLTVLVFYLLARELYDQRIALLATALLAADRWHVTFSRIVYELILVPLVLSLQILFLVKALKSGRRRWWALSGMVLALGMNTYTAYRVIPFFMMAYFGYWLLTHRDRARRDLEGMALFFTSALLAVAPLGMYILHHWSIFVQRMRTISVFRDVEAVGSYAPIWSNLRKVLLMFNYQGDMAALNNLPGAPMLHAAVAIMMVLGLFWALRWFWKELPALYLLWFGSVASLAVMTVAHEAPNARRPIGLVPLIYLLVAVVLQALWFAWQQAVGVKRSRPLLALLLAGVVMIIGANLHTYFRVQAVDPAVWYAFSPEESAIGAYLSEQPDNLTIYLDSQYFGHAAIRFIGGDRTVVSLNPAEHIPLRQPPPQDALFIFEPKDEQMGQLLQQLYPTGVLQTHADRYGRTLFYSFYIPASAFDEAQGLRATYFSGADRSQPPVRQGRVAAIQFDYTNPEDQPLLPPFSVIFEGALLAPTYGAYRLELTAEGGQATLLLDGRVALTVQDGVQTLDQTLAAGFQAIRLEYTAGEHPGILQLAWMKPDSQNMQPIPADAFYTLPGASNGLIGYYYDNPTWSGQPVLVQRDLFITPNDAMPSPYSVMWVGKVAAPEAGTYVFGTRSDDGSLVYIDSQLVVDNGGQHGAEYKEGAISLVQGWHEIQVLYSDWGGSRAMELWWRPPGGNNQLLPSRYLRPVEGPLSESEVLPPLPEPPTAAASLQESQPGGPLPAPETLANSENPSGELGDFASLQPPTLWTFGSCGADDGQLSHPSGVAVDNQGRVYVADTGNHRVVVLDAQGAWVTSWGEPGEGAGQFEEVFDIAITPDGNIAVLDAANQIVSLWTPAGEFLREVGRDLALYHPRGLDVVSTGDMYIADTGGGRLVQADDQGAMLAAFAGPNQGGQPTDVVLGPDGFLYAPDPAEGVVWVLQSETGSSRAAPGPRSNTVESPHIAILPDGRVFLTDPEQGRVLVYEPGLRPLAQLGVQGSGEGQFNRTLGVAVKPGMVIVTDPDLCRVTAFQY